MGPDRIDILTDCVRSLSPIAIENNIFFVGECIVIPCSRTGRGWRPSCSPAVQNHMRLMPAKRPARGLQFGNRADDDWPVRVAVRVDQNDVGPGGERRQTSEPSWD